MMIATRSMRSVYRPLPWLRVGMLALTCTLVIASSMHLVPQAAPATATKPGGPLSPRLAALAQALSLPPDGPGSLLWRDDGTLLVYVHAPTDAPTLAAIRRAGTAVRHVSQRYSMLTVAVAPGTLAALAAVPGVRQVQEALAPVQPAAPTRDPRSSAAASAHALCPSGQIVSEGDGQLRAAETRATYGVDGSGVTVGVLTNSFDVATATNVNADDDIASGDLPGPGNPCGHTTPVQVLAEPRLGSGNDEARGMLQIVHDLAPGANLAFATAADGLFAFADNIRRLRHEAGADVLVDDFFYVEEPFFQDGPINVAIREVVRDGATYVTAGGNVHLEDAAGNGIGAYDAPAYRPTACPQLTDPTTGSSFTPTADCHDFDPSDDADADLVMTLPAAGRVVVNFQWSEPWFGVGSDFDIYLVDAQNSVLARAESPLGFAPFEALSYDNPTGATQTVKLVVVRFTGANTPRIMFTLGSAALNAPGISMLEYADADNGDRFGAIVTDHASAAEAITVGAVAVGEPSVAEPFSSRGPAILDWQPVVSIRPAQPLPTPDARAKPNVMATNGVRTTFLGRAALGAPRCDPADPANAVCRFFGTSASAPHVAAVLALMQQRATRDGMPLTPRRAARLLEHRHADARAA